VSNPGIGFAEHQRTVIFMCRETITSIMKETGVNTLKGFNNLAQQMVKVIGAERGIKIKEGEEHLWALGTLAKDDAPYLASYLTGNERSEIVDLRA
jgi:hypothetical protein